MRIFLILNILQFFNKLYHGLEVRLLQSKENPIPTDRPVTSRRHVLLSAMENFCRIPSIAQGTDNNNPRTGCPCGISDQQRKQTMTARKTPVQRQQSGRQTPAIWGECAAWRLHSGSRPGIHLVFLRFGEDKILIFWRRHLHKFLKLQKTVPMEESSVPTRRIRYGNHQPAWKVL